MKPLLAVWLLAVCYMPAGAQNLPQNWAGAGGAFNASSRPPVSGWTSYASLISEKARLFSYTTHDIFLSQTKPYTIQSSVRTGIATPVREIGDCLRTCFLLLGLGDVGMAAGGQSAAGAFAGGGIGVLKFGRTNWTLAAGGHVLKVAGGQGSQTVILIGMGRVF